jgi:hypothetical protein
VDGVPGGMDNGEHVGVEEQIPSQVFSYVKVLGPKS